MTDPAWGEGDDPGEADPAEPALTQGAFFAGQARDAWQAGQTALGQGDLRLAIRWLERASRIAPEDPAMTLALAVALLRHGAADRAEAILDRVTTHHDAREAWLMLAAARLALGHIAAAGLALAAALSRYVCADPASVGDLADRVVAAGLAPGWCGVRSNGEVVLGLPQGHRAVLMLDGRRVRMPVTLRPNAAAERLDVTVDGRPCLGSPLLPGRTRRLAGVVAVVDGGLEGWAWHPGNPDANPVLHIRTAGGRAALTVIATDLDMAAEQPLARPRRFRVTEQALARLRPPISVHGPDGTALPGSPLDPGAERRAAMAVAQAVARRYPLHRRTGIVSPLSDAAIAAATRGPKMRLQPAPDRPVAVVVPVHRGHALTLRCLERVLATLPAGGSLVVVDDATPEPALAASLDTMRDAGRLRLIRHGTNRGFPASANAGMRQAARLPGGPDIVLLNSDALVTPGWIEGLRAAVHTNGDVGTATPLSNDATILSYPDTARSNPAPEGAELDRMARLAQRANPDAVVEIPTAVGFCMYVRRECLQSVGVFREDAFAQGYGEENDFCLRARHLGWLHVGVPGVYVAHIGGQSFGAATAPLVRRNLAVLERLHPGYGGLIAAFQAGDPLAASRRRLDTLRWHAGRRRGGPGAVILVTHDSGGGVERVIAERAAMLRASGHRAIVLRPALDRHRAHSSGGPAYRHGRCRVEEPGGDAFPNLEFLVPSELADLARLLRGDRPVRIEVHHLLGHEHAVLRLADRLGIPLDIHVHDYSWFCPRVTLLGPDRRYCGEPADTGVCDACVADAGRVIEDAIAPAALRARSGRDLAGAARVVAPSADAAARIRRQFPGVVPVVEPQEPHAVLATPALPHQGERRRVCVIGGIGPEKGYDIVLACARDAAQRRLPLEFVIAGRTPDDRRLMETGRVFVTGAYREGEGEALIRGQGAHLAWLPSIWPETWCFTLGVAWRSGLKAAVFDIGAQAERVRASGLGWIFPLGLPIAAINNALLAVEP